MSSLDLDVISEDELNNIKNSIIEWEDDTWCPDMETKSVSSFEEDETKEIDTDYDDSDDEDYMPHICVRTGGALKTPICLNSLQTISMEDTVHDAEDNSQDPTIADIHPIPETAKIMVEDDIIGQPASITYHSCLKLLAEYLVLPVNMCTAKYTNTNAECGAHKPFEVNIHSGGTAAIVEWICCNGHTVWKWSDVWHGSKNLSKKIHAAGQQKGCAILQMWNKDICNHFWYCCKTADTYEEFIDMWVGVLHHVTGEHTWALGECKHGPLLDDRDKELIESGSVAHERLAEIILDERWLKVVPKYLNFRSTADLESFHNHILMYASKRFSFSPPVYMLLVPMLAGLDYTPSSP
ncbi:uncharacterized protein LOC122141038 [Cyprinus carpio]|uniref:Uncharacterized protein LOC122141038 n=1 Tax=Cyprinus carpio TaxID=7962 RepID=A0A9Q9XJ57_CYPCA|nr:uncharacterized protein LOC122141038 [Cyprinus carpio]